MKKKIDPNNLRVLIVDDVKSMRSIARSMLKNMKIVQTFHMAENGVDALKILHSNSVDIAIVDWKMPVMNGAELLENIRSDRRLRDLPVLMVTGESEKDIVIEAAEIEVDGYLLKPLTPSLLEEKINSLIQKVNDPEKAILHIRKARQLEEKEDYTLAIKHMQRAVELKPGASRLLRKLGILYQKIGDEQSMEKNYIIAVSANNQDVVTLQMLGEYYLSKKDFASATNYYQDVVEMTRKFNDEAIELGARLLENNHSKPAKELFSNIISKSPKNVTLVGKIAEICIQSDELVYALTQLKKLSRSYPTNYDLIFQMGAINEMMENVDAALENYLIVDKNLFARIDVKLKLAHIFYHKKKMIQADNYLNRVLKTDPNNENALALRRLL